MNFDSFPTKGWCPLLKVYGTPTWNGEPVEIGRWYHDCVYHRRTTVYGDISLSLQFALLEVKNIKLVHPDLSYSMAEVSCWGRIGDLNDIKRYNPMYGIFQMVRVDKILKADW